MSFRVAASVRSSFYEVPKLLKRSVSTKPILELTDRHSIPAWGARAALPIESSSGIHVYSQGRQLIDFSSQLMCVNIGHGDLRVVKAASEQMQRLCYAAPNTATEPRVELTKLLASIAPGDINQFYLTTSGALANEAAIKAARQYTGRQGILSFLRGYSGATDLMLQVTGDPRRWSAQSSNATTRILSPKPYNFSFGDTDEEIIGRYKAYLREYLETEGGHKFAALLMEPVTGSNGVIQFPPGLLFAIKQVLDEHGILLILDEVMSGFGRTGKMFASEHEGIVPDIMTMAKGLTSGYLPLGAMGWNQKLADHFAATPFIHGETYAYHPVSLAAAKAAINVLIDDQLVENAERLGHVMSDEMNKLNEKHPSIADARSVGLFGMFDLQADHKGTPAAPYHGTSEQMQALQTALYENGVYTILRSNTMMCAPPLVINEEQLRDAYARIDKALEAADRFLD